MSKPTDNNVDELVYAIKNDGVLNGHKTDNKPWVKQLNTLIEQRECEARIEELRRYIERGDEFDNYVDYRIAKLEMGSGESYTHRVITARLDEAKLWWANRPHLPVEHNIYTWHRERLIKLQAQLKEDSDE